MIFRLDHIQIQRIGHDQKPVPVALGLIPRPRTRHGQHVHRKERSGYEEEQPVPRIVSDSFSMRRLVDVFLLLERVLVGGRGQVAGSDVALESVQGNDGAAEEDVVDSKGEQEQVLDEGRPVFS